MTKIHEILPGKRYGVLTVRYPVKSTSQRVARWKCGCAVCRSEVNLTPTLLLKGKCPECHH